MGGLGGLVGGLGLVLGWIAFDLIALVVDFRLVWLRTGVVVCNGAGLGWLVGY